MFNRLVTVVSFLNSLVLLYPLPLTPSINFNLPLPLLFSPSIVPSITIVIIPFLLLIISYGVSLLLFNYTFNSVSPLFSSKSSHYLLRWSSLSSSFLPIATKHPRFCPFLFSPKSAWFQTVQIEHSAHCILQVSFASSDSYYWKINSSSYSVSSLEMTIFVFVKTNYFRTVILFVITVWLLNINY